MLTDTQISRAEEAAEEVIIQSFGSIDFLGLPVDLNVILDRLALTLKIGDFGEDEHYQNVSGAFDRNSSTIFISNKDTQERQAFTVAHEIGHFKLHQEVNTELFYRNYMWQFDNPDLAKQETEANWFAASLLMPREAVKKLWDGHDVDGLARVFGVSKSAMYYRLKNLRLI